MNDLQRFAKELQDNVKNALDEIHARQSVTNQFMFEKLSKVDQEALVEKLRKHDEVREEREEDKAAKAKKAFDKYFKVKKEN